MSFTEKFRAWTDSTKNIVLIVLIVGAVAFGVLSITGDFMEDSANADGIPGFPSKAVWAFTIKNTGNVILSKDYTQPSGTTYQFDGYWELVNDKFKWRDGTITLDEKYFGPIKVERIVK